MIRNIGILIPIQPLQLIQQLQMQDILRDPQTIPFLHNSRVNLHCLKKQINRRVDKIRLLLLGGQPPQSRAAGRGVSFGCQTEGQELRQGENGTGIRHRRVLSTYNSNIVDEGDPICQERPSLPYRKKRTVNAQHSAEGSENLNIRTRVSDYLTSKREKECVFSNLVMRQPSECSDEKEAEFIRESQEDKIFTSIEFQLHNSEQTVESLLGKSSSPHFTLPVTQQVSSQEVSADEQEDQENEGRKSFSTIARRQLSTRKLKFTERTNLTENEARIIVSDECRLKIMAELEKSMGGKRKEPTDNKLRLNIIKKIEERYGDYYENF